jgi:predicted LPLAT superfamily acyltransferase
MEPDVSAPFAPQDGDEVRSGKRDAGSWVSIREKGSLLGIQFIAAVSTLFGRRAARLVLHVPVLYFVAFHAGVRRASRQYLSRITGRTPTLGMVYQHVLCFARVTLDRLFLLQGRDALFRAVYSGHEHLVRLHGDGRGAMLFSAHLGSSAAMRLDNRGSRFKINIAGYFQNAQRINSLLERLDPETSARVIHLNPSQVDSVLAIRERIAAGEMIAMTADRTGVNERSVDVPFLGGRAAFPTAPFLLAALLRCPVYLVFALYRDPDTYELHCEPFEQDRIVLQRGEREAALRACVERYARRLEHYCRMAPYNWFNFYDFWAAETGPATAERGR